MKKNDYPSPLCRKKRGKFHLFVFFMMVFFWGVPEVHAQKFIDLNVKNESLVEIFKQIQEQTDYRFMYSTQDVKPYAGFTLKVKNGDIENVLNLLLKETNLVFLIENNVVFIKRKVAPQVADTQGIRITGLVVDEDNKPLPGVTVRLGGTTIGTSTDANGNYSIVFPKMEPIVLFYSFVGMVTEQVVYKGKNVINVVLKEEVKAMDEVVVTGYQKMRKSDVVGSVTTVNASDVMMPAYTSIDQMLQGRVAGMMVMQTSSRVGTSPKIRIRGSSTILGNQDPLWVVDGVIQPDPLPFDQNNAMVDDLKNILGNQISWLNPADIETITVLKDASATAIYGSKAANGVIVITTKRGQRDRMTVNYSGTFSFRTRPHYGLFNLMNSKERIQFSREAFEAGAIYSRVPEKTLDTYEGIMSMLYDKQLTSGEAEAAIQRLEQTNTDWFDLLTRNSFSHNHNLSMSGGGTNVIYNASIGYSDQSGIEIGNDTKNLSGRLNVGVTLHPKVHMDMSLTGAINKTWGYAAEVNPMDYATNTSRSTLAFDENGDRYFQRVRGNYSLNQTEHYLGYNIQNEMDNSYSKNKSTKINGTLNFKWDVLPWLSYELVGGINNNSGVSESYAGEQTKYIANKYRGYDFGTEKPGSEKYNAAQLRFGGELYNGTSDVFGWNIQNKVTFQKTFNEEHRLNVLLGTELSSTENVDRSQKIFGYVAERGGQIIAPTPIKDLVAIGGGGANNVKDWGILQDLYNGNGWKRGASTSRSFSVFATLAYSLKNRYVLNASMRNDASNRFGQDQNKRFDPTYSFGVSWNVAQESWMQSISNILNQFTLRASYGIQGNTVNSISPDLILKMGTVKDPYGDYMSMISRLPNPNLSWERTKTWNFGVDIQLVQWVTMNLEYYTKSSNNIVNQVIALENGRSGMEINGGRITNSGVEYSLNITPIRSKDWGWTIGLNSSKNWNEAKTQSISDITLRDYLNGSMDKVLKMGYALSSFWSFDFKGLNPNTGSPEFNRIYEQDEEGNFVLDEKTGNMTLREVEDYSDLLVYSGKTEPDFTGGLTTRLRWKGLVLGANFSLVLGAKKRLPNPYPEAGNIPLSSTNMSKELMKRWKKPGDEKFTSIPGVYTGRIALDDRLQDDKSYNMYEMWHLSDLRVVDASFLRCQQLSLSWNVDGAWCTKIGFKSLSFNAVMNNVFVIADKKFDGFDPELGDSIQPKTYSLGITVGF